MDNIANFDIDLDALEAEHNKMLEQYKNAQDVSKTSTNENLAGSVEPLIPDWFANGTLQKEDEVPLLVPAAPKQQSMIPLNSGGYQGAWRIGDPPTKHWNTSNDYDSEMSKYDNEEDPRGSVPRNKYTNHPKRDTGKTDHWQAHAWADDSEEDMNDLFDKLNNTGHSHSKYNDETMDDFVDFGEDDPNPWGNFIDEPTSNGKNDKTLHLFMAQMQEKGDEMSVTMDKLSGDVQEISRDVGEILPLVSDTNEDLREVKSDVAKITNRVVKMEATLRKLDISITSLNNMMEIIVQHFQEKESDLT